MWQGILKVLVLGLVPPTVWRMARGARLAPKDKNGSDTMVIDRDSFLWEVCTAGVLISLLAFAVMASGWLPFFGSGFVYGADLDPKIEVRVAKTEKKIDEISKKQTETSNAVKDMRNLVLESLIEGAQAKIRSQLLRRCKTLGADEREEINREIERLQVQHNNYRGYRYSEPRCDQL